MSSTTPHSKAYSCGSKNKSKHARINSIADPYSEIDVDDILNNKDIWENDSCGCCNCDKSRKDKKKQVRNIQRNQQMTETKNNKMSASSNVGILVGDEPVTSFDGQLNAIPIYAMDNGSKISSTGVKIVNSNKMTFSTGGVITVDTINAKTIMTSGDSASENLSVSQNLAVGANATISNNLNVGGNVTVMGDATFTNAINTKTAQVSDSLSTNNLSVAGNATINNSMVSKTAHITDSLSVDVDATVAGTLTAKNVTANADINATNVNIVENLSVIGNSSLNGNVTSNGLVSSNSGHVSTNLNVGQNVTVGGSVNVAGELSVVNASINNNLMAPTINTTTVNSENIKVNTISPKVGDTVNVTGDLSVTGVNKISTAGVKIGPSSIEIDGGVNTQSKMATAETTTTTKIDSTGLSFFSVLGDITSVGSNGVTLSADGKTASISVNNIQFANSTSQTTTTLDAHNLKIGDGTSISTITPQAINVNGIFSFDANDPNNPKFAMQSGANDIIVADATSLQLGRYGGGFTVFAPNLNVEDGDIKVSGLSVQGESIKIDICLYVPPPTGIPYALAKKAGPLTLQIRNATVGNKKTYELTIVENIKFLNIQAGYTVLSSPIVLAPHNPNLPIGGEPTNLNMIEYIRSSLGINIGYPSPSVLQQAGSLASNIPNPMGAFCYMSNILDGGNREDGFLKIMADGAMQIHGDPLKSGFAWTLGSHYGLYVGANVLLHPY